MLKAKERFGEYLKRRYGKRSTAKHYLSDLSMFIEQVGDRAPASIRVSDVDEFVASQVKRGLQGSSINRRVATLHTFFEFLASEVAELGLVNPVNWRRHGVKESQLLPRDASEQAVEQLFAKITDARDQALFGLLVGAGLRVGEVVSVTRSDLQAPLTPEQCARLRVKGKGEKERMVWLTPKWYGLLQSWLRVRPSSQASELFLNQHARPLSVAGVQYRLQEYCQRAGLQVTCHQLRHTFARRLAEQHMPTESIGQLLGHQQLATTQRYTAGANLEVRDAFLAAMTPLEKTALATATTATAALAPVARQQPQRKAAELARLEQAQARFASLPAWLRAPLADFLAYRWRNWQPQQAVANADSISRQLLSIWQALLSQGQLTCLADLKRPRVEAWLAARQQAGLAANTRRTHLTLLLASLRFMSDQATSGEASSIDAHIFRIQPPEPPHLLARFLADVDYQALLQTVHSQTARTTYRHALDRAWFLMLAHTGLRTCELLDLRLADLDFSQGRLFVRGAKNFQERVAFLTPTLTAALATYLAQRPALSDDHLWLDLNQSPLTALRIRYCVQAWGKAAQVPVSPHRLRHTFATQLINRGLPLLSVSKLLGHRSLASTQHYARLYDHTVKTQFEQAMAHIEGLLMTAWPTAHTPIACPVVPQEQPCDSV